VTQFCLNWIVKIEIIKVMESCMFVHGIFSVEKFMKKKNFCLTCAKSLNSNAP
jgi:ribosomal protein S26